MRKTNLRFDIAPLKSYYEKDGSTWINPDRQHADIYVFAWHEHQDGHTDHRDAGQWSFFVVVKRDLPPIRRASDCRNSSKSPFGAALLTFGKRLKK